MLKSDSVGKVIMFLKCRDCPEEIQQMTNQQTLQPTSMSIHQCQFPIHTQKLFIYFFHPCYHQKLEVSGIMLLMLLAEGINERKTASFPTIQKGPAMCFGQGTSCDSVFVSLLGIKVVLFRQCHGKQHKCKFHHHNDQLSVLHSQ